ncbi:hypothetical protein F1748_25300 (plasmid) [Escherichia coli]|uniref:hypothetical protein n=1 Tax=Escherichia coli TaxID=562 RepID=UPI001EDFACEA|nr:hypothetical protein [Escherichia coli]UKR59067.1 hypothetical protein F1748_25300 [Escherichia coli]
MGSPAEYPQEHQTFVGNVLIAEQQHFTEQFISLNSGKQFSTAEQGETTQSTNDTTLFNLAQCNQVLQLFKDILS